MIKCVCGKIFENKKQFYNHIKNCLEYLDYNSNGMRQWISEHHTCEKCGKVMTEFYGTGRFCSRACANSHQRSDESRLKTSDALFGHNINFDDYVPEMKDLYFDKKITYKHFKYYKQDCVEGVDYIVCPYCGIRVAALCSHVLSHGKKSKDVKEEFGENYPVTSQMSQKRRQDSSTIVQQTLIDEGRHKGWQSRDKKSYAEQFWIQVLDNNNIDYQREFVVNKRTLGLNDSSNFFLDFLLPGNIDLEIDGKQHGYEDRKEHDKERDAILTQHGYIIYRIQWINPNTPQNKLKVQNQIKEFLDWYQNLKWR